MLERLINRHKNCGGFILPDMINSFTGMDYGYCPKCGKNKLICDDYDSNNENITLYTIHNKTTKEYLLYNNDNNQFIITFESEDQANKFANDNDLNNYEIKPNVALFSDTLVTNGKMITEQEVD